MDFDHVEEIIEVDGAVEDFVLFVESDEVGHPHIIFTFRATLWKVNLQNISAIERCSSFFFMHCD